jgi:ParB-like chromosome segregation protein Spo0J
VLAAHLLGLDEVPCIVLTHLTPTQRRAYVLADNKLALNAGWDLELLSLEIGELGEAGFDLNLTGFDEFELGELCPERTPGRTDPDDAPEPPAHPVAEAGDLWVLGRHRLLCGDSTMATDVEVVSVRERLTRRIARIAAARTTGGVPETDE